MTSVVSLLTQFPYIVPLIIYSKVSKDSKFVTKQDSEKEGRMTGTPSVNI